MRPFDSLINLGLVLALWLAIAYGCMPCRYQDFPGTVTVTGITPAPSSARSPDTPDALLLVAFEFTPDNPDIPRRATQEKPQPLSVTRKTLAEKGIILGGRYHALRHAETQGTCSTPVPFSVDDWR